MKGDVEGNWIVAQAAERSRPHGAVRAILAQVERVREEFGIERMTFVGDRGMLTETKIEAVRYTVDTEPTPWQSSVPEKLERGARTQ